MPSCHTCARRDYLPFHWVSGDGIDAIPGTRPVEIARRLSRGQWSSSPTKACRGSSELRLPEAATQRAAGFEVAALVLGGAFSGRRDPLLVAVVVGALARFRGRS